MELNIGILGSFQLIKSINLHFWFGINKYRLRAALMRIRIKFI